MEGCEVVFHCAALTDLNSPWEQFEDIIVEGTRRVLQAAVECNIQRVVNVSSEAALVTGFGYPLVDVDDIVDHLPDPDTQIGLNYPRAKNLAERVCQSFASQIHVVTVRPRFIWGAGDTVVMKHLVEQAKSLTGFAWIGGAEFMTSTANISNVIHGILLASEKGVSGHSYFLTDEEDLTLKEMFTKLFSTQRIDSSSFPSLPILLAKALAWTGLIPDVNATSMALLAQQVTVKCPKAKEDLGYSPIVSMDQGMEELRVGFDMKKLGNH
jgi:nucleoside-diphosphate-sugar epimerase